MGLPKGENVQHASTSTKKKNFRRDICLADALFVNGAEEEAFNRYITVQHHL